MEELKHIKRVVLLGKANKCFKRIPRHKICPFQYNGSWFISVDFEHFKGCIRPVDKVTLRFYRKLEFYYHIISNYLFIEPL